MLYLLPFAWKTDEIHDACTKLRNLIGKNFEAEMREAVHSGELLADGCSDLLNNLGNNLENTREFGREACVDWDDVAEWLRAKGYDVTRDERDPMGIAQVAQRWRCTEATAMNRLRAEGLHALYTNGDGCPGLEGRSETAMVALDTIKGIEDKHPDWLKFDAFHPEHSRIPWLDLSKRKAHDAQRQRELARADPAGDRDRRAAAKVLGMERLSCWLEPERIAQLYGDPIVSELLENYIDRLPCRGVCTGFAFLVDDVFNWPGMPPVPDGEAGKLVRAWFSLANKPEHKADKPEHKQRPSQIHRERCRTAAAMIWTNEPNLTISEMIERDEITATACEHCKYTPKTLRDWIADLCPDRSPGRRPSSGKPPRTP